MPVPIKPQNNNNTQENNTISDYSFLANLVSPQQNSMERQNKFAANNRDAESLMTLWLNGEKCGKQYKNTEATGLSKHDIMRLKANGLVKGDSDKVSFTNKGKHVITTLTLAEQNKFANNKQRRAYTEIVANNDKRGKPGYRTPRYASNTNNSLRFG